MFKNILKKYFKYLKKNFKNVFQIQKIFKKNHINFKKKIKKIFRKNVRKLFQRSDAEDYTLYIYCIGCMAQCDNQKLVNQRSRFASRQFLFYLVARS